MQGIVKAAALIALAALVCSSPAQELKGKKVYYINAYHTGYAWSDGEEQGVLKGLEPLGVEVKIVRMDTYRDKSPEHLAKVAAECQATIDEWKPDVVVVSDDAPMKAVYKPFYKDKDVPFVFCGVNWTAEAYGVPNKNVTGMLEVCPVQDLVAEMKKITPGKTIGFLAADALTHAKMAKTRARLSEWNCNVSMQRPLPSGSRAFLTCNQKSTCSLLAQIWGSRDGMRRPLALSQKRILRSLPGHFMTS